MCHFQDNHSLKLKKLTTRRPTKIQEYIIIVNKHAFITDILGLSEGSKSFWSFVHISCHSSGYFYPSLSVTLSISTVKFYSTAIDYL